MASSTPSAAHIGTAQERRAAFRAKRDGKKVDSIDEEAEEPEKEEQPAADHEDSEDPVFLEG